MSSKHIPQSLFIENLHAISNNAQNGNTDKLSAIPIIHELGHAYVTLHNTIRDFPKLERYTLGTMIEKVLLECIEACFVATTAPIEKYKAIVRASALFDTLKLFVRISVQTKCLPEATYIKLIPKFGEIGRMLGGWLGQAKIQNPNPINNS